MEIKLTIRGNPAPKKNSQKIMRGASGKPFVAQGDRYRRYAEAAVWQLKSKRPPEPITTPVNVRCVYYRQTRVRCDLVNLLEATCDILVDAGILADDNFHVVAGHDGSRVLIDAENPRVEITITEAREYAPIERGPWIDVRYHQPNIEECALVKAHGSIVTATYEPDIGGDERPWFNPEIGCFSGMEWMSLSKLLKEDDGEVKP